MLLGICEVRKADPTAMTDFVVWVTREEEADGPLSTALRARGLGVLLEPVLERRLVAEPLVLIAGLGGEDWLVLTSPFAIRVFAAVPQAHVPRVAVVGGSSARVAHDLGLRVELTSPDGHGDALFEQLRCSVTKGIVCYPRSALARPPQPWAEVDVRSPVLYETVARPFDRTVAQRARIAAVASPSAVAALAEIEMPLASIGRATSAAIHQQGRRPAVVASYPSFEHLSDAIAAYASDSRHHLA
jgi:uroporphyrinogen-III synthase